MAVIRVGGATEVEVKERKDRVDDAMHATRAAVEEGVVAGGGVALLYATDVLAKLKPANDDQKAGIDIVRRALQAPARLIAENAGIDGSIVIGKLLDKNDPNYGFDAQSGKLRRHGQGRHHRSDQGRAAGLAGRGVGRGLAGDDGSDGRRKAGEENAGNVARSRRRHGRHGRHGFLIKNRTHILTSGAAAQAAALSFGTING